MSYFKLNNNDYSMCVNALNVSKTTNYNALTNAAGDTVVDFINQKRTIEVGIIPLDANTMKQLLADIDRFSVTVDFLNPKTNTLEQLEGIIPDNAVEYYTIQANDVKFNGFNITITEL